MPSPQRLSFFCFVLFSNSETIKQLDIFSSCFIYPSHEFCHKFSDQLLWLRDMTSKFVGAVKVTRPSFLGGYHPTLKLSGIPTFTFIASLTHRMDNI